MVKRPLVSVVTGTWQRHDLLIEAIENVRQQTYPNIEHVIISDGPDDELKHLINEKANEDSWGGVHVPIRFVELGRNWSTYLTNSFSVAPFMVAQMVAAGDFQMWMSDDERMLVPDHIEALVNLLEETGADFAAPLVEVYYANRPDQRWVVGTDPPQNGTITHCVYRTKLLDIGGFRPHVGSGSDWDQAERWLDGGAKFALLPRMTYSHRTDKIPGLVEPHV